MNTKYKIKNFRVFDSEGAEIKLNPLTFITGCNSSGKSSIVKSLLLLCDYLSQLKEDKENGKEVKPTAHKLDFAKKPHNLLGKFSKVVNEKATDNVVTMAIQVHSLMLMQDVELELSFGIDENDNMSNGYIKSIVVRTMEGTVVYSSNEKEGCCGDFYSVIPQFFNFIRVQHVISTYQSLGIDRELTEDVTEEEYEKYVNSMKSFITDYKKENTRESLLEINAWNNAHRRYGSFLLKNTANKPEMIEKAFEKGMIYYLPILDAKLSGEKEESLNFLSSVIADSQNDKALVSVLSRVFNDFKESDFASFVEYYKSVEKAYLSDMNRYVFQLTGGVSPRLFRANDATIKATEIMMSPYNVDPNNTWIIWGDDKAEVVEEPKMSKEEKIAEWDAMPITLDLLFEAMAMLSHKLIPENEIHYQSPDKIPFVQYSSRVEYLFFKYLEEAIEEIVVEATPDALSYVSSSIINVKRLYPLESNDEFTELLKKYVETKRCLDKMADYVPNTFMDKWIKAFGIGERISINVDDEGLGITLRLHKSEADEKGMLLADNGYGITQIFAILLNIEVAIMSRKSLKYYEDKNIEWNASIQKKYSEPTIAIEEPEIHLHPRYQSLLAEMFYDAYKTFGIHFIIETHSEYLIRKSQVIVAGLKYSSNQEAEETCPFRTYYMPNNSKPYSLGYRKDGKFAEEFGSGFYDEATNLAFDIL